MKTALLRVVPAISALSSAGFLVFLPACASGASNLCTDKEVPIFACSPTAGRIVSVCRARRDAKESFYLVYRFGTMDGKVELQLPKDLRNFRKAITGTELVFEKRGEDDNYLRFHNGRFNYVVYSGTGNGFEIQGLAIFNNERLMQNLPCKTPDPESLPLTAVPGLNAQLYWGIPTENDTDAKRTWNMIARSVSHKRGEK